MNPLFWGWFANSPPEQRRTAAAAARVAQDWRRGSYRKGVVGVPCSIFTLRLEGRSLLIDWVCSHCEFEAGGKCKHIWYSLWLLLNERSSDSSDLL